MKNFAVFAFGLFFICVYPLTGYSQADLCEMEMRECEAYWASEAPDAGFFVRMDTGWRLDIEADDGQGGKLCGAVLVMQIQRTACRCVDQYYPTPGETFCEAENEVLSNAHFEPGGHRPTILGDTYPRVEGGDWRALKGSAKDIFLVVGTSARPTTYGGIKFPAGAASFSDRVVGYEPEFSGGPAPDETQQDARQILGVPEQGEMSLGTGGRIRLQFLDNSLRGSDDDRPDLYIFEVGGPETTYVDIGKNIWQWHRVGTASGFASGIDIDQFGFDSNDRFSYVRLTDDGDSIGDHHFTAGADLVAVGARSAAAPVEEQPYINYRIRAYIGGRSELIMQANRLQWHHLKGPAPGLERQFWNPGRDANSPTIIDSNHGPNITWVPEGWPINLGNGTHPESYSSVFNGLTPVFPNDGRCWRLEKQFGDGNVKIVQQPNASNGYALIIRFDDLITGHHGGLHTLAGSGSYSVTLSRTFKTC